MTPARAGKLFSTVLLSSVLAACGGGSGNDSPGEDRSVQPTTAPVVQTAAPHAPAQPSPASAEPETEAATPTAPYVYQREERYPRIAKQPLRFITSRSGKPLGVYVTLPADENGKPAPGPFPVLLAQSAYNLSLSGAGDIPGGVGVLLGSPDPYFVKRGYAVVAADALGTGVSGGGWELLGAAEQEAYADVVDWIEQQPWFNGKLGLAGASYMAISGLFTAQQRPDSIDAIFAAVPLGDAMRGTVGTGGMLNALFMSTWMVFTQMLTTQNIPAVLRYPQYYNTISASTREHIEQIDNYYLPLIEDALNGAPYITYDSEFWRTRSPIENIDRVKAPTLLMGALIDIFQRDVPLLYEKLKQNGTETRLMIYDGDHLTNNLFAMTGNNKVAPMRNLMLQWFDHYLMGLDTGVEKLPPVTQFVKNYSPLLGFGYTTTTDWPHPEAVPERWYLHGDNSLSRTAPESIEPTRSMSQPPFADLEFGKNTQGTFLKFLVKMNDGTSCSPSFRQWTLGAGGLVKPQCAADVRKLEQDALNYESAPMDEDYYINGPIQADIWLESSAHEAVLSVRVDEVSRSGRVTQLSNGLLLASMRAVDEQRSRYLHGEMIQPYHYFTQEAEQDVVPGEVFKMSVEIFPTSVLIRKGSKLRISISPSNQAQGVLNLPRRERAEGGVTTIHHSPEYPSSVVFPVVPLSALN